MALAPMLLVRADAQGVLELGVGTLVPGAFWAMVAETVVVSSKRNLEIVFMSSVFRWWVVCNMESAEMCVGPVQAHARNWSDLKKTIAQGGRHRIYPTLFHECSKSEVHTPAPRTIEK